MSKRRLAPAPRHRRILHHRARTGGAEKPPFARVKLGEDRRGAADAISESENSITPP